MATRWQVVTTRHRGEIWLFGPSTTPPLIWGVHRADDEPIEVGPGVEVYGVRRDILARFLDTVVRPALDGGAWILGDVHSILELYLQEPTELAPLLAILMGRVHLAAETHTLSDRGSELLIRFLKQLPLTEEPHERQAATFRGQLELLLSLAVQARPGRR
jgi:hypothetical protein